jgi:hypothetical protein
MKIWGYSTNECTGKPFLDLAKIFRIHLFLSGVLYFGFGAFHITSLFGPCTKIDLLLPKGQNPLSYYLYSITNLNTISLPW